MRCQGGMLALALACAIAGCRDEVAQRRTEIMQNADAALNHILEKGPKADPVKYLQEADRLIGAIPDAAERREVIEMWMDRLLSFDFSRLNFDRWCRVDMYIRTRYINLLFGGLAARRSKPEYFAYRIKLMEWWRRQLNRIRPWQVAGNEKIFEMPNLGDSERRTLYRVGATSYEFELHNLEKEAIDLNELYTTKEEAAKIRAMVEKFLGRPIRPREELEKDFNDTHHVEFTDTYNL